MRCWGRVRTKGREKTALPHKPLYSNHPQNPHWKTEEELSALPGEIGRILSALRFGTKRLAAISNEELQVEACAMLREKIKRTPWFRRGMTQAQRQNTIEREVDRLWHLFVHDAAQSLVDRMAQEQQG